jgi:hypothetical protein
MKKKKSNLPSGKLTKTENKPARDKKSKQDIPIFEITLDDDSTKEATIKNVPIGVPVEEVAPKKLKPREKEHYVNSREFEEEIRQFYKTGHVTIKLGESINKIANGLSYAPNFINYSYKEDMVGDAIVKMFSALKNQKFKLDSGFSPFSYFTTIAFHAFINRIKKEKKHHEAVNEYREKVYTELMLDPEENGGAHIYVDPTDDDYEP